MPRLTSLNPHTTLLNSPHVRRSADGRWVAGDVVAKLGQTKEPAELWEALRRELPHLDESLAVVDGEEVETLDAPGVLKLAMAMTTPAARRVQRWMAEQAAVPPTPAEKSRHEYEKRGEPNVWIDRRQLGKSARRELASAWSSGGAVESDDYRMLTNALFESTFGMDVASYRQRKGLTNMSSASLRDHMSDAELALTVLAETLAAMLIRRRGCRTLDETLAATRDAGAIAGHVRAELDDAHLARAA